MDYSIIDVLSGARTSISPNIPSALCALGERLQELLRNQEEAQQEKLRVQEEDELNMLNSIFRQQNGG